jgi:DNA-binding CsgD family transcriptional regulator
MALPQWVKTPHLVRKSIKFNLNNMKSKEVEHNISLTPREWEILEGVSLGLTNEEIAKDLSIATKTVTNRNNIIFKKLGVRNRVEAANIFWEYKTARKSVEQHSDSPNPDVQVFTGNTIKSHIEDNDLKPSNIYKHSLPNHSYVREFLGRVENPELHYNVDHQKQIVHIVSSLINNFPETNIRRQLRVMFSPRSPKVGEFLMTRANEEVSRDAWKDAQSLFRAAEIYFGPGTTRAASAGLGIAHMNLYLGGVNEAICQINSVKSKYARSMDTESLAYCYMLHGWLEYYQGNYEKSKMLFNDVINIVEESGNERIGQLTFGQNPYHYIGRINYDKGVNTKNIKKKQSYFSVAKKYMDTAHLYTEKWGISDQLAFEELWQYRLLKAQGLWEEAEKKITKAGELFESNVAYQHVSLEYANLASADRRYRKSNVMAEQVLRIRSDVGYAKGMADALETIAQNYCFLGDEIRAYKYYILATRIYPYQSMGSRRASVEVDRISDNLIRRLGVSKYRKIIYQLQEDIDERKGYFKHLENMGREKEVSIMIGELLSKSGKF